MYSTVQNSSTRIYGGVILDDWLVDLKFATCSSDPLIRVVQGKNSLECNATFTSIDARNYEMGLLWRESSPLQYFDTEESEYIPLTAERFWRFLYFEEREAQDDV